MWSPHGDFGEMFHCWSYQCSFLGNVWHTGVASPYSTSGLPRNCIKRKFLRPQFANYDKLLRNAATSGSYTDMMHVFAASTVINAPIRSYCPPSVHPEFVSDPLTRIVCGRGVRRFKDLREQHYCTKQSQLNSVKLKI